MLQVVDASVRWIEILSLIDDLSYGSGVRTDNNLQLIAKMHA